MAQRKDDDNSYEFDAPSHIDLKAIDEADNADNWFDNQASGAHGHLATPIRADLDSGPGRCSSPPANIVTSWGDGAPTQMGARPKRKSAAQPPALPRRVSKRKEAAIAPAAPPVKKHRRSATSQRARRSSGKVSRSGRSTPKIRAAATHAGPHLHSSEEQELEHIRNLQREVAEHRRKNEASYKAALAGSHLPKKLALVTTVPEEFHFSTDARVKGATASNVPDKEVDFITQLRKHTSPTKALKGATVPKPFHLSTSNKRKVEESAAYVSVAEQIEQFERRTPDRYHLRSRRSQANGPCPVKGDQLRITKPHTPQLMTRQRSRPVNVKSSADLEAEEVDRLHKFQFKALELNRKILESALNPKKPAAKEATKAEGFELQIEKRLQERQAAKKPQEAEEKRNIFHSRPLPTKILEGVVGVPEKKSLLPTVPESPAFALKKRVRMERKFEDVKQSLPIKAHPVPHFGLPFQPQLSEKNPVEVCPFSFEEREQERKALKELRLEELRNEEVPKFKAQPLPDFDAVVLPEKKVVEATKPKPFRLLVDQRGAVKVDRWEQTMKEEQRQLGEAAIFKAGPNTVIHKEPFQPKKENRTALGMNSSTVVEPFELSTERRAREWQEYGQVVSEKEALRARMEEQQRQEEEQRQKEDVAKLRQEQVHKAQPIRHYKPVELQKSDAALTVPHSPNFSDRFRR